MNVKRLLVLVSALIALSIKVVFAESVELTVSGNGQGSASTVTAVAQSETKVEQSNVAEVANTVDVSANTGDNQAQGNNGDTSIQTGSIDASTAINNQNINTNVSDANLSSIDIDATIAGNGATSINSINTSLYTSFEHNQTNVAFIINNVSIYANTGENKASDNKGEVTIQTGDIVAHTEVVNRDINYSVDPESQKASINLSIVGNGTNSANSISFSFDKLVSVFTRNEANIKNDVSHDLNTGFNTAIGNNGSILISTGDILSVVKVANEGVNVALFNPFVPRGKGPEVPSEAQPSTTPIIIPAQVQSAAGNNEEENESGGGGESVGAAVSGISLPVTGSYFLFLLTLGSIIGFLTGWYLRLRAGRSPNFAYVYA